MSNVPFATARLEGHEVVLTIGDEQIRYDNSRNGYQSAHAIAQRVNEIQTREEQAGDMRARYGIEPLPIDPASIDEAHRLPLIEDADRDEPPTKVEGQRRSSPPPEVPITTPTGEKPAA